MYYYSLEDIDPNNTINNNEVVVRRNSKVDHGTIESIKYTGDGRKVAKIKLDHGGYYTMIISS